MDYPKLELTDTEWMSLIDGSQDSGREGSLMVCCANISELRDAIISVARNGGEVNPFYARDLEQKLGWVISDHEIAEIPALVKVAKTLGIEFDSLTHEPRRIEL